MSWSWGETQTGTMSAGGGGGAGKVDMQDFHFVMTVNKATPKLILACAGGRSHQEGRPDLPQSRQDPAGVSDLHLLRFDRFVLSNRRRQGDVIPIEQVSLNYTKMEIEYKAQKPDGSLDGGSKPAGYEGEQGGLGRSKEDPSL